MKSISVKQLVQEFKLEVLAGGDELDRTIKKARTHRPGLEFIGYFDFFPMERVQILGKKEINFLKQQNIEERKERIDHVVSYHPPCFIVTSNQEGLTYLTKFCQEENIPLLRTADTAVDFIAKVDNYLTRKLATEIAVHGVCLNVSGIGVLIRGESGVGKSELAHTLIGRGHRLVSDDIVILKKVSHKTILGTHNDINREFLALRSVGLLNVVRMYGRKAFQDESRISLDIELTKWEKDALNNDLEPKTDYEEYMGVQVPRIEIQLQPGRDVAGLVEAAANNWYLQQQGYKASTEFMERVQWEEGDD
ncbi:HPr kinase/phosphorylase [Oceanobacillus oncorhynchi subsp. incaldanensis]|uniref:HPr kinase/phosphorylase n=1 Tax=Oceanobacillus oncorhynchi TaxID=545501 RepID=A0A0A1MBE7_9BACI|nr:HPr(Ser) kinase/phosphatase [Oceanobacillus oncorhynchi]MDM8101358.1 HPr(Ser) kinase/phosphatase [Oceanobacillus oncorhynchi]UUI39986.1 HPr(Ser) kinase/phosphatase [Oceanobacillus oncorhynchi]GIO20198.1 HPr kinase/phosphorylase [Oceanobacillus oncorhynchi subsp. incaldanensis]CEI80348.1 HPr kinase/phosphorylase [Oceanobacillus oncorhynchi]